MTESGIRPIRILHIFGRMDRGGAEMRTLDLMRNIDRSKYQLEFCALSGLVGDLDEDIRALGGAVHYCKLSPNFVIKFRRLLRRVEPDVVHSHVQFTSGFILRLAAAEGIAVRIAHFRATGSAQKTSLRQHAQYWLFRRWLNQFATRIVAVSQGALEYSWLRFYPSDERCGVIYNGIDSVLYEEDTDRTAVLEEFGLPTVAKILIHVGRFAPEKNHTKLVEIFHQIHLWDPDIYLLLVGQGENELERKIRERCKQLGLIDRVIFAGLRRDIPRLMKSADVLVFPSTHEGLPGAVLEACAAGLPVVGSDIPGIREIQCRLPRVHCIPVSESNKQWASLVMQELRDRGGLSLALSRQQFLQSDFNLEKCVEATVDVWERG